MKLFLCEPIDPKAYELLKSEFTIIDSIAYIHECTILISRNLNLDADFLQKCRSLKLIIVHGSGCDGVDIPYLEQHSIALKNTPGLNALSVSELIVAMMLQLSRQTNRLCKDYKDGKIKTIAPDDCCGVEISGKTFGMIGVGRIAIQTAKILKYGFQMKVIGYSRSLTPKKAAEAGIEYCRTKEEVLKNADFVSLGTALTSETRHIITSKELSLMKPTACLINTARGGLIDETALYNALSCRQIAGAALDVLTKEPPSPTHPLLQLDQVLYTPHIGGSTKEALHRVGMQVFQIALQFKNADTITAKH